MKTFSESTLIVNSYTCPDSANFMKAHGRCLLGNGAVRAFFLFVSGVALALFFSCVSGCKSSGNPEPETILLTDHARLVAPGETVPSLPAGETRWWLCTPTGLRQMLPADAPVLRAEPSTPTKEP